MHSILYLKMIVVFLKVTQKINTPTIFCDTPGILLAFPNRVIHSSYMAIILFDILVLILFIAVSKCNGKTDLTFLIYENG